MSRPLRIEYSGAIYHIISRGNDQRSIFGDSKSYQKFLNYLEKAKDKFGIVIHAYCLMDNHYHLLMETPNGNLCRTMQYVNSSYTTYYNVKNKRNGHLLQGRYKSILVEKDSYFLELGRYIHLNPVRAGIIRYPEDYAWSSYKYYLNKNKEKPYFLRLEEMLGNFDSKKSYKEFVVAGMKNINEKIVSGFILGSVEFIEEIKKKYLNDSRADLRDLPEKRFLLKVELNIENIRKLLAKKKGKDNKKFLTYFLRKYGELTLKDIAEEVFNKKLSVSGVSQIVRRIDKRREEDSIFNKELSGIERKMSNV